MLKKKEKYRVYITHNTYRGMLLEAGRHPGNESIIQMPGVRIGNDFFFDMVCAKQLEVQSAEQSKKVKQKDLSDQDYPICSENTRRREDTWITE